MDGSNFAPHRSPDLVFPPREDPDRIPDREWSLSAPQVTLVVLGIVAVCEIVGLLA